MTIGRYQTEGHITELRVRAEKAEARVAELEKVLERIHKGEQPAHKIADEALWKSRSTDSASTEKDSEMPKIDPMVQLKEIVDRGCYVTIEHVGLPTEYEVTLGNYKTHAHHGGATITEAINRARKSLDWTEEQEKAAAK